MTLVGFGENKEKNNVQKVETQLNKRLLWFVKEIANIYKNEKETLTLDMQSYMRWCRHKFVGVVSFEALIHSSERLMAFCC